MRTFVAVIGALVMLAGLTEIILPQWTLSAARGLYRIDPILISGFVAIAIGMELVAASVTRRVGLRTFVAVIGVIMAVFGLVCAIQPGWVRDLGHAAFLQQPWGLQLLLLWITGAVRILIGAGLIYAALRQPMVTAPAQ